MGFIQKDALRTSIINYSGLALGYVNKGLLFVLILSTEEIGLVNLLLGVGLLFAQLSNLGTINAIFKFSHFFKGNAEQKISFLKLNLRFVFIGVLLFSIIIVLLKSTITNYYSDKSLLFVDYYYWIIPIGIANVIFSVFEYHLRSIYINIISVFVYEFVLRLLITLLLIILWQKWIDFNTFLIFHALIYFIPPLVLFIYLIRINELNFKRKNLKISKKLKRIIFQFSLFSYANTIGYILVSTIDLLMIAAYLGLNDTGIYSTMIYLSSALIIPYKSLIRISASLVPEYWKEKKYTQMKLLYQNVSTISLIIILYLFGLVWFNRTALFSFLPSEFSKGIWVFFLLMMGKIVDVFTGINGIILVSSKKYKIDTLYTIGLVFLVLSLNYFLIPLYGIFGVAISTSIALIIYNVFRVGFVYHYFKMHPFKWSQLKIMILFSIVFLVSEYVTMDISTRIFSIILKSLLVTLLFFIPMIYLNLEPELNKYLKNIRYSIFKR